MLLKGSCVWSKKDLDRTCFTHLYQGIGSCSVPEVQQVDDIYARHEDDSLFLSIADVQQFCWCLLAHFDFRDSGASSCS